MRSHAPPCAAEQSSTSLLAALRAGLASTLSALCLLALACLALAPGAGFAADVLVLISGHGAVYRDVSAALEKRLAEIRPEARLIVAGIDDAPRLESFAAVAAIGSAASDFISRGARGAPPSVHALVPSSSYLALPEAARAGSSAVFVDQPVERQLALVRIALPGWNRLALLHGERSRAIAEEVARSARGKGMEVASAEVGSPAELYTAIQDVLAEPSVLLALPDGEVFNSHTVQNILLTAYREKSPVFGFSPAYARAGALLALFTPPAAIGRQAADLLALSLAGESLPAAQYPKHFEVLVNERVARSMKITTASAEALTEQLIREESSR